MIDLTFIFILKFIEKVVWQGEWKSARGTAASMTLSALIIGRGHSMETDLLKVHTNIAEDEESRASVIMFYLYAGFYC